MFSVPSKGASSKGATAKRLLSSGEFNSPKRTFTPDDVGKYVDKVKRGLNSPLEKKSKSFAFARMYFDAKEFNQARKYLEDFLTVQDRDFRVHNLLGETHEALNNNAQALQAYKRSLELCSTQKEILIKVVELCCKTPIDPLRAKVWADKANKMCPGHPAVFELKWHLLNLESPKDYEEMELLLADELTRRAHDSSLHVKLVNMYIEADSLEQAFMHCQSVQKTNAFKNDLVWLECSCDTFQLYKNNDHGENKTLASLLFALSLCELMNLHLKSKDTNICQTTLKRLDALLYKLENTNSVEVASAHTLEWKDCVCETKAQLYLSAAVLLMKLADQGVISWMQANRMAVIYLLASWTVDIPASTTKLYARHSPIKKQTHASYHWSVLACTRLSQAGHLLLSLESQFGEEWVQGCLSDFTNPQGQKKLLDTLLTKQESNVKSFLNEDESLYNLQLELPTPEQLVVYDEVTVAEHADNLHLIIWLGLHWNKLSEKIKPGVGVMVGRLYEGISLDVKNMRNCHFSSMCLRDVEGFIYAVIRSSKNIHTECHKDNDELKLLPLPICPSLVSPAQQEWWQAAYTLYTGKVGTLSTPKLKVVLQKGLETIRCQRDHGIDARILMYMAVAFIEKAMEVEMGKKQEYDYQEHWESLQRRAVFYMKEAIKILEIFKRNKTIPMVENPLIPPISDAILPDEVLSMLNKNYLKLAEACILSNDLHDALKYYDQVNSLQAMYSQAQIYIQLASQSNTETLDGEKDHVYYISKAKEKLTVCIANADHSPEFKQTLVEQLRGLQTLQTSSSVGGAKKCLDFQRPATPQLLAEDLDVSLDSNVLTSTKAEPSAAVSATTTKSAMQHQLEFENESLKHTLALYKAQINNMAFQQQALMHGYPPIIPPGYMTPTGIFSPQGLLTPAGATSMVIPPSVMTTPQQHLATPRQQIVPVSQPLHIQQQASPRVVPQQYVYPQSAMPLQGPLPAAMPMHGPLHPDMQLQGPPPQPLQPQQSSMPPQPIIPPQIVAQSADGSNFQQQPTFNTQNQFNNQVGAPQLEQADYTQSSHLSLVPPRLVSSAVGVRSDSNPVTPTVGLTGESQNSDMWWDSFSPQPTFEKGYFSGLSEHVEQLREESGEGEAPTLKDTVTTTPQAAEAPTDATTPVIELDDIYVEPIVKLGAQCETVTGEEGEEEKFVHRAKLYRFDKDGGQWKERGVGDVKILWNNITKKARITMRRDQVFRVCCNHFITPEMKLEAKVGAKGAWSWFTAADASDDDIRPEQYTIKFKEAEKAEEFRDVFLKWQKESDEQTPAAGVVKEKKAIHIRPLANMLNKPKCDSWACDTCMVLNPPDCTACLACKTAKPNKDVKKTPEKKESTPSTSAVPWFSVKVSESCVQESPEGKPVFAFATTNNQVNPFFAAKTGTSQPVLTSASQSTSNIFANVLTSPEDLSLPGNVHHSQSYPIMTSLLKQQTTPEKAQTIAGMDKLPAFEKGIVESNVDPSSFWQSASPEKIFFTGNTTALESLGHQEECKQDTEEDDASNLDVTPLNNTDYDGDDYYYGDNCYDENGRYYSEGADYYEGYGNYDPNEDFGDYDDEDEEEGEDEDESGQVSAANSSRRESYEQQISSIDHANIQVVPDEDIVVYTDEDLSITFEMQPSAEQLTKAAKHQLPATFYLYENCEGCSGCVGCKDDFVEVRKVVERRQPAKEFEVEQQPEQQQRPSVIFGGGKSGAPVNLFAEMASAQQGFGGNTGGGFSGAGEQLFSTTNEDNAEEYDPHYEAIVQVDKLATITTGEEDDDVMFKHRAKLYRYDNQWKERGVGDIKLTKNRQTGYCRVIMRRDIIHKLCANHAIMPNMELKLLPSSDKAWVWGTPSDYAEGIPPVPSLFCIKFKNTKVANEFKTVFETLKETMITTLAEMEKDSTADKKVDEQPKKDETPSLMSKFALKADEWECTGCDVRNDKSSAVCVACNSPNPNAPATETKQPANFGQASSQSTFSFGQKTESPFSFGQKATQESPFTFVVKPQDAQNKQDDTKPTFSFGQKTTTESTTPFAGFKPATNENPFPSKTLFGSSDENKDAKDHSSSCAQKETTQETSKDTSQEPLFSFGKIQPTEATTESQPTFSFGAPQTDKPKADDKPSFSFGTPQGANEPAKPLFSFTPKSPLTSKDSEKPEVKSSQAEEVSSPTHLDEERDIHVEAIASVTKLDAISTGEENEETIHTQRLKLYRYDADSKSWKERGIGELKLTKNSQTNVCRVIMRREQVRKLCANHLLLSDMQLKPLKKSDKAWTWLTQADISDGEPKKEHFCAKFKTVEDATKFKESFEKCQSMLSSAPVATPKDTKPKEETNAKVDLRSKLAPKEGSWECDVCMIANESSFSKCVACQNPNPNAPVNDEVSAVPQFSFGTQQQALSTGFSFVAPSNASGFSFGASSTTAPMFGSSNTSAAPTFVNTSLIVATKSDTTNFSPFTFEAKPATGAPSVLPSNPETSEVPSALEEDPETWQCPMCLAKNKSERKKCRQCEAERQKTPVVRLDPSASKPLQFNPDMFKTPKTPPKNNTTKSPFVTPTKDLMPPPVGLPIGFTTPKQKTSPKQTPLKSSSWMPKGLQNITFSLGLVQSPSLSAASSVEDLSEASKTSQVKSLFGDGSFAFNFDKTATPPKSPTKPSAIKSPQSPTEVEGADCEVEFTPIVSLAHVAQTTTGEEKEEVIFCERSKMFRYQQNQWKERGVGEMRILKSKLTGQCRLLLRRDQTFKLCANHMLLKDMTIKLMGTTKNAYIWKTLSDISDGEPVEQTFAAKFKVEERASEFAKVFEEATQGGNEEGQLAEVIEISSDEEEEAVLDPEVEITYEPMISESSKKKARELLLPHAFYHQPSVVIGDRPTKTSAQSSSCADTPGENDRDVVITHVKQVEISPSKDTLLLPKSFYNYLDQENPFNAKTVFSDHGYILIGDEEKEGSIDIVVEDSLHHIAVFDQNKTLLWRREITRDVTLTMPQGSKTVFECEDAALKFDDMPSAESFLNFFEERKPQEQQDKVFGAGFSGNTFGGQINGGLTFATLASEENSGFQSNAGKNFSGKGAALFGTEETVEKQGEIYVEPIVQLSSVKVTSGEDEEAVVFFERCKLYRFDDKKWKERGVGELKLLQHRTSAKARLVMRRDQTHKLCANHYLSDVMKLEPFKNNDRTLMWSAFSDVSDTTPLDTVFAARFKNDELVSSFRSHFTSLCNGERLDEIAVRQSSPPPDAPAVLGTCDPHIAL